ncbi:SPOSA6832_00094 [Sporobolomyces salmonicolor]|uniref:SPOSA6832_00094-mRNA-1:cds n=1 Tax=Sporidiobolus salmonicolor TaxID=5005 RepID=A0A0D6EF42_SPOSA|nr:SPOSA6832_00094 [Sporobolomyces salmonicolor]
MATPGPPTTLFTSTTIFSLLATVLILLAAVLLARAILPARTYADKVQRWTFVWLAFDALIHFFLWQSFPRPRTVNSSEGPLALLWQEYALADTRWGVSDPCVVAIELLTVLGAGPLTAELYGGWMTAKWITGSPSLNTSHWLYTYVYLLFFNGLWVIIPILLMVDAYRHITRALRSVAVQDKKQK